MREADFLETLEKLKGIIHDVRNQSASSDQLVATDDILQKLHRLRPRGVRLSTCALVKHDGLILAVTRKEDATKVCMPGGFTEPDDYRFTTGYSRQMEEMARRSAARELAEETGYLVANHEGSVVHCALDDVGTYCTMVRFPFARLIGTPKPEAGTMLLWLEPKEFMQRCAWPEYYRHAREWEAF